MAISQEPRCQRWSILESRFRLAACANAGSASGEYLVTPVLLIVFPQVLVIAKHFIPPLLVNVSLGTVLWAAYSESSSALGSCDGLEARPITIAAISGAVAGGAQAIVAAPAENVRLVIERGTGRGWSHAWKEVLRGTAPIQSTGSASLRELRQVRSWTMDVRAMAGRGWNGWGWGLAKDVCGELAVISQCGRFHLIIVFFEGFSMFFTIFEVTRHVAKEVKLYSLGLVQPFKVADSSRPTAIERHLPRVVHGFTLVAGGATAGLAYEVVCRPWDATRRLAHIEQVQACTAHRPRRYLIDSIARKIHDDGLLSFFRDAAGKEEGTLSSPRNQRLLVAARTLGRVGPWGVAFLVWETFGPGIS